MEKESVERILNNIKPVKFDGPENKDVRYFLEVLYGKQLVKKIKTLIKFGSFFKYKCPENLELCYYELAGIIPKQFNLRINCDLTHCTCDDFTQNIINNNFTVFRCEHI